MKRHLTIALLLGLLSACSGNRPRSAEVYRPETSAEIETVAILGTNDIHGALAPLTAKTKEPEGVEPVTYERGGAAAMAAHLKILREKFGSRLLWLDAGDEFQGSLESNIEEGAPMVQWFNAMGLSAATLGNHEFDFGPVGPDTPAGDPLGALKARMAEARYPYLVGNIVDRKTGKRVELPNSRPSVILQAGRIKVGVIGLTTLETPVQTRPEFVKGLAFEDPKTFATREAARLRQEGAQVVVLLAHAGTRCEPGPEPAHALRKPTDPQGACDEKDELAAWLKALPAGTVDAVVSGHRHVVLHHWINDVPVIQGGHQLQALNVIYLSYDVKAGKLLADRTRIEGPIPVCPKVFEHQRDCAGDRPAPKKGRGDLVTPQFFGEELKTPAEATAVLDPIFKRVEAAKKRVVAQAARPVVHVRPCRIPSELGALVADALRLKAQADVGIVNCGMIRTGLEQGDVTYGDVFRIVPFDNTVARLTVSGKQLRTMLRIAESGARGFFPTSGVQLKVLDPELPAKSDDLDGNGKIEAWEINRLVDARLADGSPIEDQRQYRVATVDFLVNGGDDMGWIMGQIPKAQVASVEGGLVRDVVEQHFSRLKTLNPADHPAIDPAAPGLAFVKEWKGKGASSRKARRGKRRKKS